MADAVTRAGCLSCLFCICLKSLYSCGFSGVFCVRSNPRTNRTNPASGSSPARRLEREKAQCLQGFRRFLTRVRTLERPALNANAPKR